ncbi:uncharacterized protein [Cicer arietinum]|uniref:Uncharacterized protein LOC101506884 n=1 Tax=Cicer arietinum TaxID=3827 RepID=A0A1S2YL06_CICAR|nr:uncharacterized protein LOC101506884 [Cicer arietinum]
MAKYWSERVKNLVDAGDVDDAILLLESVVEDQNPTSDHVSQLELASVLSVLANLYSSKGLSLKADTLLSRASLIKQVHQSHSSDAQDVIVIESNEEGVVPPPTNADSKYSAEAFFSSSPDDDWEALAEREIIVDREADKLLSIVASEILTGVSNIKLENTKSPTPKRRGRGTFSYDTDKLYSDQLLDGSIIDDVDDKETHRGSEDKKDIPKLKHGTGHVLVLANFAPSTRTTDLEKLFDVIKNCDFVIRWVNDTVALAVFRTPAEALEAQSNVRCPFNMTMRILGEDDVLLSSIKANDLEPPRQRPKTSVEAAQRLIAHSMGIKFPSPSKTGSREHKRQEDSRRDRIVNRQKLKDDAWGED